MAGNKSQTIKDITLISIMITILFVQEQLLSSLPGIQLTIFLIVLFSKKLGLLKTLVIVLIHVLLDNLVMGSFSLLYTPSMLIGWLVIPLTMCTVFKKVNSPFLLGLLGVLYAFIYSWLFLIASYLIMHVDILVYFIADILYEIVLAACSFVSILLLYKPCSNVIDNFYKKNVNK